MRLMVFEIVITGLLLLIIKSKLLQSLWDQSFLDTEIALWRQSPLIDVQTRVFNTGGQITCPDNYEPIGSVKFEGTKWACKCKTGTLYGEECTEEQKGNEGCITISPIEPESMQILNDKYYCALKETGYNFLTIKKPFHLNGKWVCMDKEFPSLCGDQVSDVYKNQYCIPAKSRCAISDLTIDKNGFITPSFIQTEKSNLVTDIYLSQGDGLCIQYSEYANTKADKHDLEIMNDKYTEKCPIITFSNQNFTTQPRFQRLPSYSVSEYDLYKQNKNGQVLTMLSYTQVPQEEIDGLKDNLYGMYKIDYHPWSGSCTYKDTNV